MMNKASYSTHDPVLPDPSQYRQVEQSSDEESEEKGEKDKDTANEETADDGRSVMSDVHS